MRLCIVSGTRCSPKRSGSVKQMKFSSIVRACAAVSLLGAPSLTYAADEDTQQDEVEVEQVRDDAEAASLTDRAPGRPRSKFSGDWFAVGAGAVYSPTYSGSNDYRPLPIPVIVGSYKGVGIRPRAGGLGFNFLDKMRGDVTFSAGPTFRFRGDRNGNIKDPVVEAAGKLDTAIEVGFDTAVSFNGVFTRFDRVSVGLEAGWDVAGAHNGMIINPGVSYSTPLDRGSVLAVSFGAQYVDGDYAEYYYSVTDEQSAASGLPVFDADSGWHKVGVTLALGFDLSGNVRDGGWVAGGAIGYRRMLGDAADTPFTSLRGDADQFSGIFGIAYVF